MVTVVIYQEGKIRVLAGTLGLAQRLTVTTVTGFEVEVRLVVLVEPVAEPVVVSQATYSPGACAHS